MCIFRPPRLIRDESSENSAKNPATRTHAHRTAGIALSTMQITIGKLMLWLLSLDALAVLLQVHVGTSNKLQTRWERFRGGATTSQAILLTSGSLVTLSGAKAVVEGQRKSSEQVRACPPPHALLLQTTRKPRPHFVAHQSHRLSRGRAFTHHTTALHRRSATRRRSLGSRCSAGEPPSSPRWRPAPRPSTAA